jgi:DNA-binding CsgD family transcriptional regulator
VLVIEGDPGIGKTTLWRESMRLADERGYRVLSCRPAEAESKLSFAGLADLLGSVSAEVLDDLPAPQRRALEIALLRADPDEGELDRGTVFAAFVSAARSLARARPLVVAVDDVQWLDAPSAAALDFALRRLGNSPIGVIVSVRVEGRGIATSSFEQALAKGQLERVRLGPLSLAALHRLLSDRLGHTFPRPTLVRLARASDGNPFFALEIARELLARGQLAPGESLPVPDNLRDLVAARIEGLPARTREALLVASALSEPTVDLVGAPALAPAEKAGLVQIEGDRVVFAHPLYASAIYASASTARRRTLHRELAETVIDFEEHGRHLGLSAEEADEEVAGALEEAGTRARARGAPDAAAELLEQARRLTPPERRDDFLRRGVKAADHYAHAGHRERARGLLEEIASGAPAGPARAEALSLLGEVRCYQDSFAEAVPLLHEALAEASDPRLRLATELRLAYAYAGCGNLPSAYEHATEGLEIAEQIGEPELLGGALGLAAMTGFIIGQGVDDAQLERALLLEDVGRSVPMEQRPSLIVGDIMMLTGRLDRAEEILLALRQRTIEHGEESELPMCLFPLAFIAFCRGDRTSLERFAEETLQTARESGSETMEVMGLSYTSIAAAFGGDPGVGRTRAEEALVLLQRTGFDFASAWGPLLALGFLAVSVDDPVWGLSVLEPFIELFEAMGIPEPSMAPFVPEAVGVLTSAGRLDRAGALLDVFEDRSRELSRSNTLAIALRCRGLLLAARRDLDGAVAALQESLLLHEQLQMPFEQGRTLLALGQVHRRRKEKRAARDALEQGLATFERLDAPLWAEKARAELARVAPRRSSGDALTPTEERVAELAATGLRNREIAERLFLSPKTVEANLARVYRKLGISSRAELGARMTERQAP